MSKFKSLQLPSQSTTPTPPSGFGTLFVSGGNTNGLDLYWRNTAGQRYNLTNVAAGTTQVRYYTGSAIGDGTRQLYNYEKPLGLAYLEIICIGAGGGGGSGGRTTAIAGNLNAAQGAGGGAGVWMRVRATQLLSPSYSISIGPGGWGGLGRSTSGNGSFGLNGGSTWFSSSLANDVKVLAAGGDGGGGGGAVGQGTAAAGLASNCIPAYGNYALSGKPGMQRTNISGLQLPYHTGNIFDGLGSGIAAGTSSAPNELNGFSKYGHVGGGGGNSGHYDFTTGAPANGYSGSSGYENGVFILNNTGGPGTGTTGVNGGPGRNNMIRSLFRFTGSNATFGLGGGGHGGGVNSAGNAGNGGNAGLYGAGGGGGGLSINGTSGNGGSGSSGLCILIEYY